MNILSKLPEPVRTGLYAVGTVGGLAWAAYEAANEDWRTAIPLFFGSLVTGTAYTHRPTK
jgi:hypothetical protein